MNRDSNPQTFKSATPTIEQVVDAMPWRKLACLDPSDLETPIDLVACQPPYDFRDFNDDPSKLDAHNDETMALACEVISGLAISLEAHCKLLEQLSDGARQTPFGDKAASLRGDAEKIAIVVNMLAVIFAKDS